jgi:hypothetical protein
VFFIENQSVAEVDLDGMPGSQQVIVVDVKKEYSEIKKDRMPACRQTIDFGYPSDWAVAIGDFDDETKR